MKENKHDMACDQKEVEQLCHSASRLEREGELIPPCEGSNRLTQSLTLFQPHPQLEFQNKRDAFYFSRFSVIFIFLIKLFTFTVMVCNLVQQAK